MSSQSSRRSVSIAFLLVASIVFQTLPLMNRAVFAQKKKPVQSAPVNSEQLYPQPQPPVDTAPPQPIVTQKGNAPLAGTPTIVAAKVDAWDDSATPDGKADPGQTITYSVTITNTGTGDATGVTFADSVDTNTTLVPGSISTQPIGFPDTYNVIGNVRIQPNAAQGLLANDIDPDSGNNTGLTASGPSTSTNGANVTINSDGSFSYNPAPGFAGTDTFTYTLRDRGPDNIAGNSDDKTDTAVATFNVGNGTATPGTNVVWFVNPAAPAGGDGRLTSPFNCYTGVSASCFSQTAADDPGDIIFLYSGAHTGGNTLLNNQKLVGQGASATLASIGGLTVPTASDALPSTGGANPTITTTNVNAIPLGQGNTIRGLTVGDVGTGTKISGTNFGTLTVGDNTTPDVTLNGTGQALNLNTGTLAATSAFTGVTTTSSSTSGLNLTAVSGTLALGSTTVSGNNNECMVISNSAANLSFGNTSCTGGGNGVSISGAAGGTRTFGTLSVSGGSGNAYTQSGGGGNVTVNGAATLSSGVPDTIVIQNANGNTISFAGGATVNHTGAGGNGIQWSGTNSGSTLTFATLALTTSNGTGMNLAGGGTVNVTTAAGSSISATGDATHNGAAIIANGIALGTNFTSVSSTNAGFAGSNGISLTSVTGTSSLGTGSLSGAAAATFLVNGGSATVTYNGSISQATASQAVISISGGHSAGTITFGGNVTATNGTGLQFNNADGTYNVNGPTNSLSGGARIDITNGSSGTFGFSSGTSITNPGSSAFNVTDSNPSATYSGTISTNNSRPVNVSRAAVGACGTVTLQTGNITVTSGGNGINVSNCSSGTVSFNNPTISLTTTTNAAVNLTTNAGATINFAATTLTISTTSGTGFNATGGGTITVSGSTNTINTTAGTGLSVVGSAGTHFTGNETWKSVSAASGTKGVSVQFLDANFSITGDNATPTSLTNGGTISTMTTRGVELINVTGTISLNHMTLNNAATTQTVTGTNCGGSLPTTENNLNCTAAVHLVNATNAVTLNRMLINGSVQGGINGNVVNNLTMSDVEVENVGNEIDENGITLKNLTGTGSATNLNLHDNEARQLFIINTTNHDLNSFNISGTSVFANAPAPNGGQGILLQSHDAGTSMTVTVNGASFHDLFTNAFQVACNAGTTQNATVTNSTFTNVNSWIVDQASGGNLTYSIQNNTGATGALSGSGAINVKTDNAGTATGNITSNTIGNNNVGSGAVCGGGCSGLFINQRQGGSLTANIVGNTIRHVDAAGISASGGQDSSFGAGKLVIVATGNLIRDPDGVAPAQAISVVSGVISGDVNCTQVTIGGSNTAGSYPSTAADTKNQIIGDWDPTPGGAGNEIILSRSIATAFLKLNYSPAATAPFATFVASKNDISSGNGTNVFVSGAATAGTCPLMLGIGGISSADALFPLVSAFDFNSKSTSVNSIDGYVNPEVTNALTQTQLDSITSEAIQRWSHSSLTTRQLESIKEIKFEVADLDANYLGEADGNRILVDRYARGRGWFVDPTPTDDSEFADAVSKTRGYTSMTSKAAGHVDLLTAIEHEIGHKIGLNDSYSQKDRDSIMYGYLTVGERRVPRIREAKGAKPDTLSAAHFLKLDKTSEVRRQTLDARGQRSEVRLNHKKITRALTPVLGSGGTVSVNVGTLAPGDSVTITFQVVVDNPYSGGPNVSNQGTVSGSNFSNVLTNDPDTVAANDPTLTPINSTDIRVNDASQSEPATGQTPMLFVVTLSQPAGGGGLSVNYATANGGATPATGGATCDGTNDYLTTSGTLNIAAGSQTGVVSVPVCADNVAGEANENFLLNLTAPSTGTLVDAQAVGTITQGNNAGSFLISELRTRGSAGAGDDFVELYNNTNSPLTVAASDASAGYGVYKMGTDCNATPVLIGTIPNGTVIPARGHYLMVGSAYSLANYGGTGAAAGNLTLSSDIEDDHNVAVFSTANVLNISSANRLDAVGFSPNTANICGLMLEGTTLAPVGAMNIDYTYFRSLIVGGNPKDTNDNASDLLFADTAGSSIVGVTQRLGAPGPENLASPIRRDTGGILLPLLDGTVSSSAAPNRIRDVTPALPTAPNGTMFIRRRVVNTTGATVTRLRFRIVDMTTFPSPGGSTADLRVISSSDVVISGINDAATCASTGTPATVPCQVTAKATTLETPPAQLSGGGYNSTVAVGTITLGTPLVNNASVNVNFALGVVQLGTFRFKLIIEALP